MFGNLKGCNKQRAGWEGKIVGWFRAERRPPALSYGGELENDGVGGRFGDLDGRGRGSEIYGLV